MERYCVLGAGHGGQSIAAYLKLKGHSVRLYDRYDHVLESIRKKGGIELTGVSLEGFAEIDLVTSSLDLAVEGATVIFVVVPSFAHQYIAETLAPSLKDGQMILICPGSTGGVLEFRHIFRQKNVTAKVKIAETNSLFYAARAENGVAEIGGVKKVMPVASIPPSDADCFIKALKDVYPQLVREENVLRSDLNNLNAVVHPIPVLLSVAWIEATSGAFRFYYDSITPSVGQMIEKLDRERMDIGAALGLQLTSARDTFRKYYETKGDTIYEMVRSIEGYAHIMAPPSLKSRLLLEDVPMGLVPMAAFGQLLGVETPIINLVIDLASNLLEMDFRQEGRSLERLGLNGLSKDEVLKLTQE